MKTVDVEEFLSSGAYLPDVLRDFHAQKDLFQAMHDIVEEVPGDTIKRPHWIAGQCYVIDVFLRFMARRGYTLQRTRRPGNFRDLKTDVRLAKQERDARYARSMGLRPRNAHPTTKPSA